ncbi:hypothetical protein ILUMI_12747, partial [Ignelater luminosus]
MQRRLSHNSGSSRPRSSSTSECVCLAGAQNCDDAVVGLGHWFIDSATFRELKAENNLIVSEDEIVNVAEEIYNEPVVTDRLHHNYTENDDDNGCGWDDLNFVIQRKPIIILTAVSRN